MLRLTVDAGKHLVRAQHEGRQPSDLLPKFPDVQAMILSETERSDTHAEVGAKGGRGKKAIDNINSFSDAKGDTDPIYALARLKRDRPDLAEKVVRGELSANAAAIDAGFRKRKIQVPVDDIESMARLLRRHFGDCVSELARVIAGE